MNTAPNANDRVRTRAGDTNACVVTNGGVNTPAAKLVAAPSTTTSQSQGEAATPASPMPTTTTASPARFSGSPIPAPASVPSTAPTAARP